MRAQTPDGKDGKRAVADMLAAARRVYVEGPWLLRLIQRHRLRINPFGNLLKRVPQNSTVLDVGCGGGLFLVLLGSLGRLCPRAGSSVGFDMSAPAIEIARSAARAGGLDMLRFELLDSESAWPDGDADDGLFNVVSVICVIHHASPESWRGIFESALSRIRPGGLFLYMDMCKRPLWRSLMNRLHDLILARQWIHHLDIRDARKWCEDSGFSIVDEGVDRRLWYGREWLIARRESKCGEG